MTNKKTIAKQKAFARTLTQARGHMNKPQQLFSQLLHLRYIDTLFSFIGNSLARPHALIGGAIGMSISLVVFYGVAKYVGYTLSGSEGIAGFLLGWILGLLYDFTQLAKAPRKR